MPSFPPFPAVLRGSRAQVRLAAEADIPEILIAYETDPELHARLGTRRPPSGAELGRRIEAQPDERAAGTRLWLTIVPVGETPPDRCAGQLEVRDLDWAHRRAELLVWVARHRRRQGLATEALRLTAGWLLSGGGLQRVALSFPDRAALLGVATAAGFTREGLLRAYVRGPEGRRDVVVTSMVAGDPAATTADAEPAGGEGR